MLTRVDATVAAPLERARGLGIRSKLLAAIAAMAALTLVAGGVAFLSFHRIGGSLQQIEADSLPGMTHAYVLAQQAAQLAAISSMIAAAESPADLDKANALLAKTREGLKVSLDGLAATATGRSAADKLRQEAAGLEQVTKRLAEAVRERLQISTQRAKMVAGAISAHQKLSEKLAPIVDDANFNLVMGLRTAGDIADRQRAQAELARLADEEAMVLEGVADLRAEGNLLLGIFTETSLSPSIDLLRPLRDRQLASVERARKAIAKLGKTDQARDLGGTLQTLLAFGDEKRGISSERERELKSVAEGWKLVAASKESVAKLSVDVEQATRGAREEMSRAVAASSASIASSRLLLSGLSAASILALIAVWVFIGRSITGRLHRLNAAVVGLAGGNLGVEVPKGGRDELSQMARAVETFKVNAIEKVRLEAEAVEMHRCTEAAHAAREAEKTEEARRLQFAIDSLGQGLEHLSEGDLVYRINTPFQADIDSLRINFNSSVQKLQQTVLTISGNTEGIRSRTNEITAAADNLSHRTEQQVGSLEETASALDQITATVKKTAEGARHASQAVASAKQSAEHSSNVVRQAMDAMGGIEKSSRQIGQIIGVIDEIAFQTNLLALNAGVEAARAGDAGRGFAVVAAEVRALAQRSAQAAKEIKGLISASTAQVDQGVDLVEQAGKALEGILTQVTEINTVVAEIATGAQEQATGLQQVNAAVNKMDQGTQQDAAMVEQSTAATHALAQETDELMRLIAQFRIGQEPAMKRAGMVAPVMAPRSKRPEPIVARPRPKIAAARGRTARSAHKLAPLAEETGWEEF